MDQCHTDIIYRRRTEMASGSGSSKKLSRLISRSLILSGIGKTLTELAKNKTFVLDQLDYNLTDYVSKIFRAGSVAEGTKTLGSDVDRMIVVPNILVTTSEVNTGDSKKECDVFLLDANKNNPGYGRLRLLKKTDKDILLSDISDKYIDDILEETKEGVFLSSEKFINFCISCANKLSPLPFFCHGPCVTTEPFDTSEIVDGNPEVSRAQDIAFAIACCDWPDEEKGWFTRKRPHNWPPQSFIEKIRENKCYVVPIGDPRSEHNDLEWRVSYLLSEREIVWSFNDTQLHCYFLLKKLLKLFLKTIAPDQLSSYHMKTLVFWLSEETGISMWFSENLIRCLEMCLDKLFDCVKQKTLQHYFNCHANLFGHKFQNDLQWKHTLEKIFEIRTNIIPHLFRCLPKYWKWPELWEIESSETVNLENIRGCENYNELEIRFSYRKQISQDWHLYKNMFDLFLLETSMLKDVKNLLRQCLAIKIQQWHDAHSEFVKNLFFLEFRFAMAYFRQITTHEDEDFQKFIDANSITSADMMVNVSQACKIDEMSGELYVATVHHFLGDYRKSTRIVKTLLKKCIQLIYTGNCSTYDAIHITGEGLLKQNFDFALYTTEGTTYPAYDVIFSNKDIYCVPDPLKFECALSEFRDFYNFVVIHPCVYAYFLLCYGQYKSQKIASFRITLKYLEKAINETKGGETRHHALNILSSCYVLDGNLPKAFVYLTESCLETEKKGIEWNAAAIHSYNYYEEKVGKVGRAEIDKISI